MTYPRIASAVLLTLLGACSSASEDAASDQPSLGNQIVRDAPPVQLPQPSETIVADQRRPATAEPRLALDPEGLRWFLPNGAARALPFGTAQGDVTASLEQLRGDAAKGINQDCGAGPVQFASWPDGLSLVFQNGRMAGWSIDGRASGGITTADGIGIGTTRSQLEDAIGPPIKVQRTSLGIEFSAGEYHGLFDGTGENARITDMWAGVSCAAR
jgi:hypothetical protein